MDHQVRDLAVGHVHPETPAGIGKGVGDVAHILHAACDEDLLLARHDRLGGQGNGLHAGGADLLDREYIGLLGKTGIDGRLPGGVLALGCIEDVAHDDLVEIDGLQAFVVVVVLLVDLRHLEVRKGLGAEALDVCRNGRPQACPDDRLLDHEPAHFHDGYAFQRTAELADGRPRSAYNDNIFHLTDLLSVKILANGKGLMANGEKHRAVSLKLRAGSYKSGQHAGYLQAPTFYLFESIEVNIIDLACNDSLGQYLCR